MAIEYVSITPGTGKNIAVDTISGNEFQIVKLGLGAEDALDNVLDAGQQLMAASVPVAIASNQSAVPVTPQEAGKTRVSKRVAVTASQTGATVWDPTGGTKFVLTKLVYSATGAGTVQFFDATDSGNTVITPIMSIAANGGFIMDWPADWPYRSAAADNILKYTSGAGAAGSIYVEGWEE